MYKINFQKPVHVHFIGIGGISMSGLAEILLDECFTISGSAPHIFTFVNEYETLYENGQPQAHNMVVANIEAGPIKEEKVNAIAEGMRAAVREVLGEDKELTLVFHDNGLDRIAIGGVTIATKMKK